MTASTANKYVCTAPTKVISWRGMTINLDRIEVDDADYLAERGFPYLELKAVESVVKKDFVVGVDRVEE